MSVPAYPNYRDSGVEWLGAVPSHWGLDRLKASILDCRNGVWGEEADGGDDDILCVRVADFDRTSLRVSLGNPTQRRVAAKEREDRLVRQGDLLLEKSGGGEKQPVGAVVLFEHPVAAVCSNFVARMRLAAGMVPAYWLYVHAAAYAVRLTVGSINQTSGIQNLDQWRYFEERAPFPPPEEQLAIAAFLDSETARIDALVEEQRRLVELLKEKRQAVISHAVTKGLDPTVPMKDSGVEWLGEVPAHWAVVKIVRLFRASKGREGQLLTKEYCAENAGEFPVYSGQTENNGVMGTLDRFEFDAGEKGYLFSTTVGAKAMTVSHILGKFSLSQNCMIIRPINEHVTPRFYFYHFQLAFSYHRALIPEHMQASFRMEDLYGFSVALPPLEEQGRIAHRLDETLTRFHELELEALAAITLLQERRAALISAAVTGKIDVRGLVPAEAEAA